MKILHGKSVKERLIARVNKVGDCWIWTACTVNGYGQITVTYPNLVGRKRYKTEFAHRVAYREFKGEIPKGKHLLHTCDNSLCINPDHLVPGTQAENMADASKKGRIRNGRG